MKMEMYIIEQCIEDIVTHHVSFYNVPYPSPGRQCSSLHAVPLRQAHATISDTTYYTVLLTFMELYKIIVRE